MLRVVYISMVNFFHQNFYRTAIMKHWRMNCFRSQKKRQRAPDTSGVNQKNVIIKQLFKHKIFRKASRKQTIQLLSRLLVARMQGTVHTIVRQRSKFCRRNLHSTANTTYHFHVFARIVAIMNVFIGEAPFKCMNALANVLVKNQKTEHTQIL